MFNTQYWKIENATPSFFVFIQQSENSEYVCKTANTSIQGIFLHWVLGTTLIVNRSLFREKLNREDIKIS